MLAILLDVNVSATPFGDFSFNGDNDLVITSNDNSEAFLLQSSSVPANYTLEFTIRPEDLPSNFGDVANHHAFVGVVDISGFAAGLFFSDAGLAYGGAFNAAFTTLPGSAGMVTVGTYYTIRIVVSTTVSACFIYVTKTSDLPSTGHQLKFVLPLIPYASLPPATAEGTHIHVKGSAVDPTIIDLDEFCLASSVLIPNLQPVADAGTDQSSRLCNIIKLDGSGSFDPEGQPLLYKWRLIDGPIPSQFVFGGLDGITHPAGPPTGFTDKFYSLAFAAEIPLTVGDVLVVAGLPYDVIAISSDGFGDFVQISDDLLPDNLLNVAFKIIKQNGISGATDVIATFFPDVPGFFKFDLVVFDGVLYSEPSTVVVNVLEAILPRGCTPDLRFLWDYLSDFWDLVEDRERIETVWGGVAQVAASELYNLWQIEYSKSIRDIQRTITRRWLHYDLFLREPFPELTKVHSVWGGVDSAVIPFNILGAAGQTLILSIPFFTNLVSVTVSGTNPMTPIQVVADLKAKLQAIDSRFNVVVITVTPISSIIRIYASFPFTVVAGTSLSVFTVGDTNEPLTLQVGGLLTAVKTYQAPFSLQGLDIREGDLLTIDGTGTFRIAGIADSPSDPIRFQRIILKDEVPLSAGANWGIGMRIASSQLNFHGALVEKEDLALFEVADKLNGGVSYITVPVVGVSQPERNLLSVGLNDVLIPYLGRTDQFDVQFWGVYRRTYMPIEKVILDIPYLQRIIKDAPEEELLRRNLDYFIEEFRDQRCIRFDQAIWQVDLDDEPILLTRLWAEYNYLDNGPTIEGNFGIPVEFLLEDLEAIGTNADYLSSVRGLWYSYLNGPTLRNLRIGTQILLGLPFAEEAGTIEEIRTDFSPNTGRILIRDTERNLIVRSYSFPKTLSMEINPKTNQAYVEGDTVAQFDPLVTGASILDWIKDPTYFQGFLNQGFFYEVEKFHRFVVRVDSAAFSLASLLFVRSFILRIKPTYTYPLFVVHSDVGDSEIDVSDEVHYKGHLSLFDGAIFKLPYTVPPPFGGPLSLESTFGSATMLDEPDPSPGDHPVAGDTPPTPPVGILSGHWQNAFDTNSNPFDAYPVFPTSDLEVTWAVDRENIAPETFIRGLCTDSRYVVPLLPTVDSVFAVDRPVWATNPPFAFGQSFLLHLPSGGSGALMMEYMGAAPSALAVNGIQVNTKGLPTLGSTDFTLDIFVNGLLVFSDFFVHNSDGYDRFWTDLAGPYVPPFCFPMVAFAIAPGDEVQVRLRSTPGTRMRPFLNGIKVSIGTCVAWTIGVPMAVDTYYASKLL